MGATGTTRVEKDFFQSPKRWSAIKHRILTNYLKAYITIRKKSVARMVFVDGYAGAGSYGEGDETSPGSPLLIAQIANEFNAENAATCTIEFIAVEKERSRFVRLRDALAQYPHSNVTPIHGDFREQLDDILAMAGDASAVFFIDPFGVKDSTLSGLRPLLIRPDTELLLVFNSSRLSKMAGFEDSPALEAGGKLRRVSEILNDDPADRLPEWLKQYHALGKDSHRWVDWAVNRYTQALIDASPHLNYGLAYPVRKRHGVFPTYHLIYATRHPAGLPVMNDLLCAEEDRLLEGAFTPNTGQTSFFSTLQEEETRRRAMALKDEIWSYGLQHQGVSRRQIIQAMVIRRPAEFKAKHYREVIDQLVKEGKAQYAPKRSERGVKDDKDLRPITFFPS